MRLLKRRKKLRPSFDIELGTVAHQSRVLMDGTDISQCVTCVEVEARVGDITKVTLSLIPDQVRLKTEHRPVKFVATGNDGVTREVRL